MNRSAGFTAVVAVVAVAAPLDENRARTLRGITNGQTGFLANTAKRGEPPRVELSAAKSALERARKLNADAKNVSDRAVEDERLTARIREVHEENFECYGYPRVWHELRRQGEDAGRDRVARLMRSAGIQGAKRRGKPWRTTIADPSAPKRPDLVKREFTAERPDALWVGDFTYLRTWEGRMFFAFLIDVFSRMIVGWQLVCHMRTDLVLDAVRMALGTRQPGADLELVCHTDQGSQGGFKWSSQRSMKEGCNGQAEGVGVGDDGAAGDAVAGAAVGGVSGGSRGVLARDRRRDDNGGGRRADGRVGGGWCPVVSGRWRDANCLSCPAVGALLIVC